MILEMNFITPRKQSTCWWKNKTTCSQLAPSIFLKATHWCPQHVLEPPELLIHPSLCHPASLNKMGSGIILFAPVCTHSHKGTVTHKQRVIFLCQQSQCTFPDDLYFGFTVEPKENTLEYHITAFNYEAKHIRYSRLILFISSSYTTVCWLQGLSDVSEAEQIHSLQW